MKTGLLIIFVFIVFHINLLAQDIPELITDRPDQTESAAIVPQGWLQVETGFTFDRTTHESIYENISINEYAIAGTLLRYGLSSSFELRTGGGYFKTDADPIFNHSGFGEFFIGTKYLFPVKEVDFAILAHLILPIGDNAYSPEKFEPEIIFSLSKDLSKNISAGINFGGQWNSFIEETTYLYSAAIGIGLNEKFGTFAEIYGVIIRGVDPIYKFDTGITYLASENFQLDASTGINLNGNDTNWFVSGGVSFRISD